jgi:hypothetical protein
MRGRWVGHELATGHPWDGKLTAAGWQGKEVCDDETVHPLLFGNRHGGASGALHTERLDQTALAFPPAVLTRGTEPR